MTSRIFPKSVRFLCSAPITSAIFNSDRAKNSNFHDLSVQPKITYPAEQFSNICHNLAKILETKINKHDTVAMIADNSVFSAIVANSIWLAGGCVMPLSGKYPNPDLEHFLEDSGAKLFLVSEEFCQKETRVLNLEVCPKMRIGRYLFSDALPEKENLDPLDLSDPALQGDFLYRGVLF